MSQAHISFVKTSLLCGLLSPVANGSVNLAITNAGFEDVSGQSVFNEFTFGTPAGWDIYDPNGITPDGGVFTGTLTPNGTEFFNETAPEGSRVAILFNSTQRGAGAYGFEQTLVDNLQANTRYDLSVEVGDIDSGTAVNNDFFNLEGFPEYRIELLAGDETVAGDESNIIAQDNNAQAGLLIEGEFVRLTLSITIGATHERLGESLGIRLVNSNLIPSDDAALGFPDLEVDFDDVQLIATSVPEPGSSALCLGLATLMFYCFRRKSCAAN